MGPFSRGQRRASEISIASQVMRHENSSILELNGKEIDLHIMTQPPSGEWVYFNTQVTQSSGRVSFNIAEDKRLGIGVYPVKMVVR
ncbi:Membrane-associated phosphatidylinositol transfer protein 2 [Goodea atripinnis]|uniref:Membrane-associated phosphatidylinositol transfer protein 2 n=1 Tax=Goodea atripinnis TaxID=208336 RepID=A0ABV0P0Y5_9TELE